MTPEQAYRDLVPRLANVIVGESGGCIVGSRNGTFVCVRLNAEAFFITASVEHWPTDVLMRAPVIARARGTGHAKFDAVVEVHEGLGGWRRVLDAAQRERLMTLCTHRTLRIARGALNLRLEHAHAKSLDDVVELVAAIASAPVASGASHEDAVFNAARREPVAAVRHGHFLWLVSRHWNPPLVYRAALTDADASIRAWARDNVPAESGAFR